MRLDLREAEAPGISALFAGAGTALTIGISEWAWAALRADASSIDLQRGLVLVCGVYAAVGLLTGLACWLARRVSAAPAAAFAAIVVIAAAGQQTRPILFLAALALGLILLRLGALALARFPALPRARLASSAALLGIAGVCALAARAIPAFGPRWALGAAVAAAGGAVLVWTPRVRGSALVLACGALSFAWQGSLALPRLAPSTRPAANAPSVLLVTIDTLRADRLGAYGYSRSRTPTLDALARDGSLFRNAFAHSVFTGPSHASILSSLPPTTSGFVLNGQGLEPEHQTLAEALGKAGYVTAAFPSAYPTAEAGSRLPGRFQFYDEDTREYSSFPEAVYRCVAIRALIPLLKGERTWPFYRPAAVTTQRAVRFLEANAGVPSFSWVHYYDPHIPYVPPVELRRPDSGLVNGEWYSLTVEERRALAKDPRRVEAMKGLYDSEVTYVDREFALLLAAARRTAPAAGLLIVVTADHGEPMGEHGNYWWRDLHDVTLHVPLIIVPPAGAKVVPSVANDVRLIDVAPTILDWLELRPLAAAEGTSLRGLMTSAGAEPVRPVVAVFEPEQDMYAGRSASVRHAGWKLIASEDDFWGLDQWKKGRVELFDVASDPAELHEHSSERPDVVGLLQERVPSNWSPGPKRDLTPEEREQLRALGYLK